MIFHNLKDIVDIYSSTPDGKVDYTWDKAKITVWNPIEQKEMELQFVGSQRNDDDPSKSEINFIVTYKDEQV